MGNCIYLDNAATTRPCKEAIDAMVQSAEIFGNPSSLHQIGLEAEKMVEKSRKIIAEKLGVDAKDIYFTSGGTESNNTAIYGAAYGLGKIGKELITTKVEHPSVLESFRRLEKEGYEVTYLGVNSEGVVDLDELAAALSEKTVLVSIMHVNNETGVIMPVDKIQEQFCTVTVFSHLASLMSDQSCGGQIWSVYPRTKFTASRGAEPCILQSRSLSKLL